MAHIEAEIVIKRPVEDVFAFITDLSNATKWQSGVTQARGLSPASMDAGTMYLYTVTILGKTYETKCRVTVYEPSHRYGWETMDAPFPITGDFVFESVPDGTHVRQTVEAKPGFILEKVLKPVMQRQIAHDLIKLKELIER